MKEIAKDPNGCASKDGAAVCRYSEIDRPACDPTSGAECKKMSVKLTLETEQQDGTCCETCSCWGDPHCESFEGKNDTWILCDSRVRTGYGCGLSKSVCLTQKDHNGNPCTWRNARKWNVGLKGSQCQFDMENQDLPEINMYEFNGFHAKIDLGERGIIEQLKVKSGSGEYYITGNTCFDDFDKPGGSPFRAVEGAADPPANPDWLPYSWPAEKVEGGDILITMAGLEEAIVINIRCTRTAVVQGGKVRFGPPRLNIDSIIEPVKPSNRKNAGGFCVTNKIDKFSSTTEHTDKIELERTCADASDELAISKLLCGRGITRSGISGCKKRWCQSVRTDVDQCLKDIATYKWRRTFCAANTVVSGKASQCDAADCKQCMSDISDFGWESSILKWTGKVTEVANGDCMEASDLPDDLIGCQKGIRIQYSTGADTWATYKAIPEGSLLCDGSVEFSSANDGVLFSNRVRLAQCNAPAQCSVDVCTPEEGFKATLEFIAEEDVTEELVKLVDNQDLVCNPDRYNTPDECLTVKVPDMCPCP